MPIYTKDNYFNFIPSNYRSNTGYIPRYNDCYILHPALSQTYPPGADATNKFITTPVIYFDTGALTEDESTLRATGGTWLRISMGNKSLDGYPTNLGTMSSRGMTLLVKYATDGNNDNAGDLKYSTRGNTFFVTNGGTFWITAGYGFALGIPAVIPGTTGATGTYTYYIQHCLHPSIGIGTIPPYEDRYYLWQVQFCFGHRVGSDPLYTGPGLIYDPVNAWADVISRGHSGGTYFQDFGGIGFPYTATVRPNDEPGPDPGNWAIEYTP